jgi:DNA repair protein RadD
MPYILRDYQKQASDAAVKFFNDKKNERNGILVLPTGAGKSLIVADIASRLRQNVLVLQPSKEILKQNYAKYRSYGLDNCSIYSASFNSKEISEVTFATIGSIMAHIDDFDHFKAIIIDECHGVNPVEGQYATFIRKVKRKVLGLTATPYRLATAQGIETKEKGFLPNGSYKTSDYFIDDFHPMPGVTLKNACILKFITRTRPRIFHDVLYEVSIQTLLQRGYLANLRYFDMTTIDTSRVKRNSTGRDYDEQSLFEEFSRCGLGNQLSDIVKRLLHPKNGVPRKGILVFTQFITESEQLAREVEGVAVVTGATKSKERDRILEDFKSGKIKVLANVGVLTTGFDYPELDTVVMARPTMSLAMWYQIVGRAIRPFEGKDGWIVDLGENIKRFGKVGDLTLREDKPGQYYISGVVNGQYKPLTNVYFY